MRNSKSGVFRSRVKYILLCFCASLLITVGASAQTPPNDSEIALYTGLHAAAHSGNLSEIKKLIATGAKIDARDPAGRTPLHVATYASHEDAVTALAKAGADMNALEHQAYDVVTIAAVANDYTMLDTVLNLGASAKNVTSPYDGTALIAAAHLGHFRVVERLIKADAPLDHINNLRWTALIEAVILGDGGPNHIKTVELLVKAGASQTIADGEGVTPLQHARARGYTAIVKLLSN